MNLNAENEKKALEALGRAQGKKLDSQAQLDNLQHYHQEYMEKYKTTSGIGVNISQLIEFRSFVSKLDKAIEDQRQAVLDRDNEVIQARKIWEMLHQKTKSMQKICEAAITEETKSENKREQNEQDDRATRSGRNSGTGNA